VPNTIPMPSINGYLKIMVGAGGKSDDDPETSENGGETKVELYNKSNNYIRQYVANGGLAGTNDDSLTEPQAGQNSLWNDRGGGGVGTCTEASAPSIVQKTGTHLKETGLCKRVLGLGRSMSNANLFGKVDGDLGPEYDMYLQWMKEYNTGYMHRAWDINGFYALNEPQSCFHDASTGKLKTRLKATDVEIADRENYHPGIHTGDETFPVLSWFQYPNRPTSNTACASLWYCSHDKAREQLGQEDEQGKKYTLPDTLNDNNFMCTFTEGSTPAETNKLREKIQAYADNPTESNLNAVWNLIKNTKSTLADNSQYHTYRTRWTPTSGDTLDELRASNFKYVCLEPEKVAVTETWNELIPARPARCENSTDGSAFGAGGGGGGASTSTVGVFGYGGNGAPGAVIIEW